MSNISSSSSSSSKEDTKIRLLQWNILADGLGNDGFLSTEFNPVYESSDPDSKSYESNDFMRMVREAKKADIASGMTETMKELKNEENELRRMKLSDKDYDEIKSKVAVIKKKSDESRLVKLKQQFQNSPELERVDKEILDWKMRYNRIKSIILCADPDVITFQEMDHTKQFLEDRIFSARYTCLVDKARTTYTPATYSDDDEDDDLSPNNYLNHVLNARVAFAPKSYSNAYSFRSKRSNSKLDLDDDGVAIFWKKEKLKPVELGFLKVPSIGIKSEAVVALTLEYNTTKEKINILTTHLPSGDEANKELKRLDVLKKPKDDWIARRIRFDDNSWKEIDYEVDKNFDGIASFARYFAKRIEIDSSRTIFALDANSRPTFPLIKPSSSNELEYTETNVWKTILGETKLESIWVQTSCLDMSGQVTNQEYPYLVSVNKMRGPLGDQPLKIGKHQLELIDHVFTNGKTSKLLKEVEINDKERVLMAPLLFTSKEGNAELNLYPSSKMPSDHLPVVVDITL